VRRRGALYSIYGVYGISVFAVRTPPSMNSLSKRRWSALVAGNRQAQAVVRVVAVDDDGQVHVTVLPGSVEKNRHLIGRALA
jgi:hypothetical protein